jgi:hypothetical protein
MPGGEVAPLPAQQQPEPDANGISFWVSTLLRFVVIYFGVQYMTSASSPLLPRQEQPLSSASTPNPSFSSTFAPKWHLGLTKMKVSVFISESSEPGDVVEGIPDWQVEDITFGGWQGEFMQDMMIDVSENVMSNGSIFAHVFITQDGFHPREFMEVRDPKVLVLSRQLNYYLPRKKAKRTKSLLEKEGEEVKEIEADESVEDTSIISYWWPNATIHLVADQNPLPRKNVPVINKSELSLLILF